MTEHAHEWHFLLGPAGGTVYCSKLGCDASMETNEMLRRLNATEWFIGGKTGISFTTGDGRKVNLEPEAVAKIFAAALEGDSHIVSTHYTAEEMDVDVLHHNPKPEEDGGHWD